MPKGIISKKVVLYLHSTSNHNIYEEMKRLQEVVLYLHSTSNHNLERLSMFQRYVVLYLHSTSNHNTTPGRYRSERVVLYLHSTSNHNYGALDFFVTQLYYIFILHQTTTIIKHLSFLLRCIISSFYIKPQLARRTYRISLCCIISSFYIKPQHLVNLFSVVTVVLYLHSTSNHNCAALIGRNTLVVLYLHSTSNHNSHIA